MMPLKGVVQSTSRMARADHSILDTVVGTRIPDMEAAAAETGAAIKSLELKTNEKIVALDRRMADCFECMIAHLLLVRSTLATKVDPIDIQYCGDKIEFLTKRMNELAFEVRLMQLPTSNVDV